jgi:hypothetical protein
MALLNSPRSPSADRLNRLTGICSACAFLAPAQDEEYDIYIGWTLLSVQNPKPFRPSCCCTWCTNLIDLDCHRDSKPGIVMARVIPWVPSVVAAAYGSLQPAAYING